MNGCYYGRMNLNREGEIASAFNILEFDCKYMGLENYLALT